MRHIINKYFLYKNEKCAIIQKCRAVIGKYGVLAQLVERQVRNLEVRGSTPLCSTIRPPYLYAAVAFFFLFGAFVGGMICIVNE